MARVERKTTKQLRSAKQQDRSPNKLTDLYIWVVQCGGMGEALKRHRPACRQRQCTDGWEVLHGNETAQ